MSRIDERLRQRAGARGRLGFQHAGRAGLSPKLRPAAGRPRRLLLRPRQTRAPFVRADSSSWRTHAERVCSEAQVSPRNLPTSGLVPAGGNSKRAAGLPWSSLVRICEP